MVCTPLMKNSKFKTVDEYLKCVPAAQRKVLVDIRRAIKSAAPEAIEGISYGMPYYKYCGRLLYFAAFENHCSFFPADKGTVKKFARELKSFQTSTSTIQFTQDKPIPLSLVKAIVKERVRVNEARANKKT